MKTTAEFSTEEIEAIEEMGGWIAVRDRTDGILREYGITRSLLGPGPAPWEPSELKLKFDAKKSIRAILQNLFQQAAALQKKFGCSKYVGAMLQHLVGAVLDLRLGKGVVKHNTFISPPPFPDVIDPSVEWKATFELNGLAVYVTELPREAFINKLSADLEAGLKPLIITTGDGVIVALAELQSTEWADRIDVLEVGQFLTANIYERSLFRVSDCKVTLKNIIERYNQIVEQCETDPVLRIRL